MLRQDRIALTKILAMPDIQERIKLYNEQTEKFKEMVRKYTRVEGDVMITDLRGVSPIYTGNRFLIYSLYPRAAYLLAGSLTARAVRAAPAQSVTSILNRTSRVNVGSLMLKYGGGGHMAVGTCQFPDDQ